MTHIDLTIATVFLMFDEEQKEKNLWETMWRLKCLLHISLSSIDKKFYR